MTTLLYIRASALLGSEGRSVVAERVGETLLDMASVSVLVVEIERPTGTCEEMLITVLVVVVLMIGISKEKVAPEGITTPSGMIL